MNAGQKRIPGKAGLMCVILLMSGGVQATCNLAVSHPEVNYGAVRATGMEARSGTYRLSERTLTLQVSCDAPQPVSLQFFDESAGGEILRFGAQDKLRVQLVQPLHEGKSAQLQRQSRLSSTVELPSERLDNLRNGDIVQFMDGQIAAIGNQFTLMMIIQPELGPQAFQTKDQTRTETTLRVALYP